MVKVRAPRVVLTGGGTGGHVYPALAVAEALRKLSPQTEILYLGGDRIEAKAVPAAGLAFRGISVHGLAGGVSAARRLRSLTELAIGLPLAQSLLILRSFRPQVVVGTGGYVSGPVLLAARLRGIPCLALDGNRTPGWTSKAVSRLVDVMAVAHPEMAEFFLGRMRKGRRVVVTGLPIRAEVVDCSRETGAAAFGFDPHLPTVVALGGSLGSRKINEAFAGAIARLLEDPRFRDNLQVLHVTGQRFFDTAKHPEPSGRVRLLPYLEPHYAEALAMADLLVARAGASTVAEVTARGLPAVLIPWAQASTGEQALNAEPLARAGAAVVIPDAEISVERLTQVLIELLSDRPRLAQMAAASRSLGRPKAAEDVAKLALELAAKEF